MHMFLGEHEGKGPCANKLKKKLNQKYNTGKPENSESQIFLMWSEKDQSAQITE